MPRFLVYLVYNLLLPLVLVVGFPSFLIKGIRRGGLARNFRQRFGHFRGEVLETLGKGRPIWVHAVSVGEIFIALKFIEAVLDLDPERKFVLSTTTTTGYAVASEKSSDRVVVIHNPVDLPWVVSKVVRRIRPTALVLIEAEIWPNLVKRLRRESIPTLLINARLSPRSASRYRRFSSWIAPVFSQLEAVTVPFEADVTRWSSIGIPSHRISVLGSIKFDHAAGANTEELTAELREWLSENKLTKTTPILLGASTHDGEELLLAKTVAALRREGCVVELVLVPRHAERGPEIASQLETAGFRPCLRSGKRFSSTTTKPDSTAAPESEPVRVWISDTTGELRAWYALASLVIVGKSLHGKGGQNPVEPILAGKPVLVGPNMQNFADVISDLLSVEGIRQLNSTEELLPEVRNLLETAEVAQAMAERGAKVMQRHKGSADRNARFVLAQLAQDQ